MITSDTTEEEIIQDVVQMIQDNDSEKSLEETITFCYKIGKARGKLEETIEIRKDVEQLHAGITKTIEN